MKNSHVALKGKGESELGIYFHVLYLLHSPQAIPRHFDDAPLEGLSGIGVLKALPHLTMTSLPCESSVTSLISILYKLSVAPPTVRVGAHLSVYILNADWAEGVVLEVATGSLIECGATGCILELRFFSVSYGKASNQLVINI